MNFIDWSYRIAVDKLFNELNRSRDYTLDAILFEFFCFFIIIIYKTVIDTKYIILYS